MATRSIASLSVTFGLVSIPVKLYSATESSAAIRFRLMGTGGTRVRQQYVADVGPSVTEDRPAVQETAPERERLATKSTGGQVIDLLEALRASLQAKQGAGGNPKPPKASGERKPVKRARFKPRDTAAGSLRGKASKR